MSSDAPFGQIAIYAHLRTLIGSSNAWRTSGEVCTAVGANSNDDRLRVQQALHKLAKDARIMRRKRPGTLSYECMALILNAKDELRAPRRKAEPSRVDIVTPAAGAVPLRVEAVPAPVLPEPTPEAREAVEKLVRSPTPALTLADVLERHRAVKVESGPLSDSNGPISGESARADKPDADPASEADAAPRVTSNPLDAAITARYAERIKEAKDSIERTNEGARATVEAAQDAAGATIDDGRKSEWVWESELRELRVRLAFERPVIHTPDIKCRFLRDLADAMPQVTAEMLRAVAHDIERAGA